MNDLLRPDDESLRDHLERRARRAHLDDDARDVVVQSVFDAAATTRSHSRRSILGLLAAAAALVLVAVVVLPVALPLGGQPSPSPQATARLMSPAELAADIAAVRSGAAPPRDAVADIAIDPVPEPRGIPSCVTAEIPCDVIGALHGTPGEQVALASDNPYANLTYRDPGGPIALRLPRSGPLVYLGHVHASDSGLAWDPADAWRLADGGNATAGDVLVVAGWLVPAPIGTCGPAPEPGPDIPEPFSCAPHAALRSTPGGPPFTTGPQAPSPDGGLYVQRGAYEQFVGRAGPEASPVRGIFLVQRVEDTNANCTGCRGWLMVGRLRPDIEAASALPSPAAPPTPIVITPTPTPQPSPAATAGLLPTLLTLAELRQRLVDLPIAQHQWTVLANGEIDRVLGNPASGACAANDLCPLGTIDDAAGRKVTVFAGAEVRAAVNAMNADPIRTTMALRAAGNDAVELLGLLDGGGPNGLVWPASAAAVAAADGRDPVGETIVVDGWLGGNDGYVIGCPTDRTPWHGCYRDWIASESFDPVQGRKRDIAPVDGIEVQGGAYGEFAPNPVIQAGHIMPRRAAYLMRLNAATGNCEPCRGWIVVERLTGELPRSEPSLAPAGPAASQSAAATPPRVILDVELRQLVSQVHRDGRERVVIASAAIRRAVVDAPTCNPDDRCAIGAYTDSNGEALLVYADPAYRAGIDPGGRLSPDALLGGTFALRLSADRIDLLGDVALADGGSPLWPATAKGVAPVLADPVGTIVAVDGWLSATSLPCAAVPGPTPLPGSAFDPCGNSWVSPEALPDIPNGLSLDWIRLQHSAYEQFAPDQRPADQLQVSRHGTYLLQLVKDPRAVCIPLDCLGWQMVGRLTTDGLPVATAGPSANGSPPPPASVLTAGDLQQLVASVRAGAAPAQDVIAGVEIDTHARPAPDSRECQDPPRNCSVLGTIQQLGADFGVVLQSPDVLAAPPAATGAPVALRIDAAGLIEYLGVLTLGTATAWSVPEVLADQDSVPTGRLLAVDGWLAQAGQNCGPASLGADPSPAPPFACATHDYITPTQERLVFPFGDRGTQTRAPDVGLVVQNSAAEAYSHADGRSSEYEPDHGIYLVQPFVNPSTYGGVGVRGWLVVGRIDGDASRLAAPGASPTSVAGVGPPPIVRTASEANVLLELDRSALIGRMLVVDGSIDPHEAAGCNPDAPCRLGTLAGTDELVYVSPVDHETLEPRTRDEQRVLMALTVDPDSLTLVGTLGLNPDGGLVVSPEVAGRPETTNGVPGFSLVVGGWLVESGPIPCPMSASPTPPPDSPFERCPTAWISGTDAPAWEVGSDGSGSMHLPADAIHVQASAYREFAPAPLVATDGTGAVPRFGYYIVQLVADPRPGADPATGWQVVGRISP